ncbi:type IV pilus inner membrane component PilO [Pseudidiomarina tainanensis]|uniref:type 4a pilus biogenesis protein PilO n=1 Tax=Pseudidiomarina tainanensis TaxID=502365 RepID=UPI0013EED015|nr:type 4a pilus biogenesis protein PilO [Pseudidiomarina tainanensis]
MSMDSLRELDINELPFWPRPFRMAVLVIIAIAVLGLSYHFILADEWASYKREVAKEAQLKEDYRIKYQTAVNLPLYREQLEQLNSDLETLLAMLPNDDETPKLLDDISLIGTKSGLRFDRIEWLMPQPREFYTALPMRIELKGAYHQIGDFVGQMSSLDRIISVKDFKMQLQDDEGTLSLSVNAETYRQQTLRTQP